MKILEEKIVKRDEFSNFIVSEDKKKEIVEEAEIEIISPVLKEEKYKWKGLYLGEKIDFSMGDSKFKDNVIEQRYIFKNGTLIKCQLEISVVFDEFGKEVRKTYSVKKVYEYGTKDEIMSLTNLGKKRKRSIDKENEPNLFSNLYNK